MCCFNIRFICFFILWTFFYLVSTPSVHSSEPTTERSFVAGELIVSYQLVPDQNSTGHTIDPITEVSRALQYLGARDIQISNLHQPLIDQITSNQNDTVQQLLSRLVEFGLTRKLHIKMNRRTDIIVMAMKLRRSFWLKQAGIEITYSGPNYIFSQAPLITSADTAKMIFFEIVNNSPVITFPNSIKMLDRSFIGEIEAAQGIGIIMVAAAGDTKSTSKFYPAAFPGVISVTAGINETMELAPNANHGEWITLACPAGEEKSSNSTNAAHHVASALRRLIEIEGSITLAQGIDRLKLFSVEINKPNGPDQFKFKILNLSAFLGSIRPIQISPATLDLNGDGYIDRVDLAILISNIGKINTSIGDIDKNGVVNLDDHDLLLNEITKEEEVVIKGAYLGLPKSFQLGTRYTLEEVLHLFLSDNTMVSLKSSEVQWSSSNVNRVSILSGELLAHGTGTVTITGRANFRGSTEKVSTQVTVYNSNDYPYTLETPNMILMTATETDTLKRSCFPGERYRIDRFYKKVADKLVQEGLILRRESSFKHLDYSQEILDSKWSLRFPVLKYQNKEYPNLDESIITASEDRNTLWAYTRNCASEAQSNCVWGVLRVDITDPLKPKLIAHSPDPEELFKAVFLALDTADDYEISTSTERYLVSTNFDKQNSSYIDLAVKCLANDEFGGGLDGCEDSHYLVNITINESGIKKERIELILPTYSNDNLVMSWKVLDATGSWPFIPIVKTTYKNGLYEVSIAQGTVTLDGKVSISSILEKLTWHTNRGQFDDFMSSFRFFISKHKNGIEYALRSKASLESGVSQNMQEFRYKSPINGKKIHLANPSSNFDLPDKIYRAPDSTLIGVKIDPGKTYGYNNLGKQIWSIPIDLEDIIFLESGLIYGTHLGSLEEIPFKDLNPLLDLSTLIRSSQATSFGLWTNTSGSFLLPNYEQVDRLDTINTTDFLLKEKLQTGLIETRSLDPLLPTLNHINLIGTESTGCQGSCNP